MYYFSKKKIATIHYLVNILYTLVNKLYTIINKFYVVVNHLDTMKNKLFTKKNVFLLLVLKMDMKLNENLKVGYFCTKPKFVTIIY